MYLCSIGGLPPITCPCQREMDNPDWDKDQGNFKDDDDFSKPSAEVIAYFKYDKAWQCTRVPSLEEMRLDFNLKGGVPCMFARYFNEEVYEEETKYTPFEKRVIDHCVMNGELIPKDKVKELKSIEELLNESDS